MDDPQNPFDGLLGDLLKILGGQGGGAPWFESARALAVGVASEGEGEDNPDPLERIALEQLVDVAARHVEEVTGIGSTPTPITPVNRSTWAVAQLDSWRPTIEKVVEAQTEATGASLAQLTQDPDASGVPPLFGQFAEMLGPMMLGLQFGSAAGHLAERALGSFALPLPWPPGSDLYLVPRNVAKFAEDWSLPLDEVRLFALTRELTAQSAFSNQEIAQRINELLQAAMADSLATQKSLIEKMTSSGDPEALSAMLSDPDAILAELVTPGAHASSNNLTAATTALGAYFDHVAEVVTTRLTASHALLKEAWHRHRVSDAKGEQAAGGLFGLDLSAREVERGQAFVTGVLERQGEDGLAKLLHRGSSLPTSAELEAPGLWLERIALPELDPGSDSAS